MKIDEQEFRSFIADLNRYVDDSTQDLEYATMHYKDYSVLENKVINQLDKYIKMLETPKLSKWQQLKLDIHDK